MRGRKVLVVANERAIQTGMSTLLGGWGCAVATAAGFEEAVAAFADGEAPDVILVDYHLDDGETGDAVIERLHGHFGRAVPSVMISADRGEALKARMDGWGIAQIGRAHVCTPVTNAHLV